ncbi:MAG: hypothetical protein LH606_10860 [Cytophagaceae bacterium]|nr:hypothetical protein [Cytophagaceae bacterium]
MKEKQIRFFSPQENVEAKPKGKTAKSKKAAAAQCSISISGRLAFPLKSIAQLGIDPASTLFKVGKDQKKRVLKSLYLIPSGGDDSTAFALVKTGRSYTISMKVIFQKLGLDFEHTHYIFSIKPFNYEEGVTGYELVLSEQIQRPVKERKQRGRKRKVVSE